MSTQKSWAELLQETGWGMHQCCYYPTPEDYLHVLIPYLRDGLLHHQRCVWILPDTFEPAHAVAALRMAKLERFLEQAQLEIVPFTQWYLAGGTLNGERLAEQLTTELDRALHAGLKGLRVAADVTTCPPEHYPALHAYEARSGAFMAEQRIIALCTAQLDAFPTAEVLAQVQHHQRAIVYHAEGCELIEPSLPQHTREAQEREREVSAAIVDMIDALIIVLDRTGRIVYFNPACEAVTGFTFNEVFEQSPLEQLIPVGDTPAELAVFKQMWTSHEAGKFEGRLSNCFGESRLISWSSTVERDPDGSVAYVIYTGMDITQTRQLEEMLEGLIQKWRDTLDALADGVALLDADGRILRCNRAMAAYLDKPFLEIIGHTFHELMPHHPLHGDQCPFLQARQTHGSESVVYEFNGRWYISRIDPRLNADGVFTGGVHVITDVTARKRAEDAVLKYQEQLRGLAT